MTDVYEKMRVIDLRKVLKAQQTGTKGIGSMTKARLIEAIRGGGGGGTPAVAPRAPPPLIGPTQLQRPRLVRPIYDRRKERPGRNAPRGAKQRVSSPMPGTPLGSPMPGTPDERTRRPRLIKPDRSVRSARGIDTPPPTPPRPKPKKKKKKASTPPGMIRARSMLTHDMFEGPPISNVQLKKLMFNEKLIVNQSLRNQIAAENAREKRMKAVIKKRKKKK